MKTTNSLCRMEPNSPLFQENVMVYRQTVNRDKPSKAPWRGMHWHCWAPFQSLSCQGLWILKSTQGPVLHQDGREAKQCFNFPQHEELLRTNGPNK